MIRPVAALVGLFLLAASASAAPLDDAYDMLYPRLEGAQVFMIPRDAKNGTGAWLKAMKEKGANTVFVRVFHNTGDRYHFEDNSSECTTGVYFQTDEACVVADILPDIIAAANGQGMKVYAWMGTRALSFMKKDAWMERAFDPDAAGGTVQGYGANILHPDVRAKLLRLYRDLAKYEIDGILLQDDFMMRYSEGASDISIAAYRKDTRSTVTPDILFRRVATKKDGTRFYDGYTPTFIHWASWKMEQLMTFYQEMHAAVLDENPGIRIAANVYYETPLEPAKGLAWYAQSLPAMVKAGVDYFAVMAYVDQMQGELSETDHGVFSMFNAIARNTSTMIRPNSRVIVKVQRMSFTDRELLPVERVRFACRLLDTYDNLSRVLVPANTAGELVTGCFSR